MLFPVLLLLSIIVVIILITLFFVRTYDTIDDVQTASQQKFIRHEDTSTQLEKKFNTITKGNERSIAESKDEMMKRLEKIKNKLDKVHTEIDQTVEMVKDEDEKLMNEIREVDDRTKSIRGEQEELREGIRKKYEQIDHRQDDFDVGMEHIDEDIRHLRDVDKEAESKRSELRKTLEELENDMSKELDILEGKIDTTNLNLRVYEESVQNDFMDVQNIQRATKKEVEPLRDAVSSLKKQIDTSKIKIADYSLNYDQRTRSLNIDYLDENDPDRAGVLNIEEIEMDKATVSDFALINNASISGTTSFQRESDSDTYELQRGNGGLNIQMPSQGSVQFNSMDRNSQTNTTQHHFSADGTAEHSRVVANTVETPKIDFGRYSMMVKRGNLVLHDSALNTNIVLSEE